MGYNTTIDYLTYEFLGRIRGINCWSFGLADMKYLGIEEICCIQVAMSIKRGTWFKKLCNPLSQIRGATPLYLRKKRVGDSLIIRNKSREGSISRYFSVSIAMCLNPLGPKRGFYPCNNHIARDVLFSANAIKTIMKG